MFKGLIITLITIFLVTSTIFSWTGEAVKKDVEVYKNKKILLNEKPLAILNAGDVVDVISISGDKLKIKTVNGEVGYVSKKDIKKLKDVGKTMKMNGENVEGELGSTEIVDVYADNDSIKTKQLNIDRSFATEMKAPVDKENLENK